MSQGTTGDALLALAGFSDWEVMVGVEDSTEDHGAREASNARGAQCACIGRRSAARSADGWRHH